MAARIGARGKRGKRPPVYTTVGDENAQKPKTAEELAADRKKQGEAEAIGLLSAVSQAKAAKAKVEVARSALKLAQSGYTDVMRSAKASFGFQRQELEALIADSDVGDRGKVQEAEARRRRFREIMGLPVGLSETERELEERLPDVERDGAFWFHSAYSGAVVGENPDPPEACVRAGFDNKFAEGITAGRAVFTQAMLAAKAPKSQIGKGLEAPAPKEETAAEKRKREKAEEEKAKAALTAPKPPPADEAPPADDPPLDPVQEAIRASAPKVGDTEVTTNEAGETITRSVSEGDDRFTEATPEELAAQTTRRAVQEEKAGAEPEAEAEGV